MRILRHALITAEVFTANLFSVYGKSAHHARQSTSRNWEHFPYELVFGKRCRRWVRRFQRESIAIVPLRLEIEFASSFECRRRWIGRKSRYGNPINRKTRFVNRREGDPAHLEVRSAGPIGVQAPLTHDATRLTEAGGDADCVRIHRWRVGYGVDRGDPYQQAKKPDYACLRFHSRFPRLLMITDSQRCNSRRGKEPLGILCQRHGRNKKDRRFAVNPRAHSPDRS